MSNPLSDFWQLLIDSRLVEPANCKHLEGDFARLKGAQNVSSPKTLAQWLLSRRVISRYQAKILLAGRPGPFVYGDYVVQDRIAAGRLAGVFRAQHKLTGLNVGLLFLTGKATQDARLWKVVKSQVEAAATIQSEHVSRC